MSGGAPDDADRANVGRREDGAVRAGALADAVAGFFAVEREIALGRPSWEEPPRVLTGVDEPVVPADRVTPDETPRRHRPVVVRGVRDTDFLLGEPITDTTTGTADRDRLLEAVAALVATVSVESLRAHPAPRAPPVDAESAPSMFHVGRLRY